jgi:hypothetical protein
MKKNISTILSMLIIVFTIALIGLVMYAGVFHYKNDAEGMTTAIIILLCAIGVIIATFFVPLIHEAGHLIFGLFNKMAFYSMRIAFLVFYREGKKLKLRVAKSSTEYAGSCEMVPKSSKNLYSRFMMMVIGGSIFTLIYLLVLTFIVENAEFVNIYVYCFIGCGLPIAFYLFAINILPIGEGGERTDGGVFIGLLKKDLVSMATINLLAIQSHYFLGETPAEVDKSLYFDVPQIPEDELAFIMLLNLRYIYYLDKGDEENLLKISDRMNNLSDNLSDNLRFNIKSDILYNGCKFKNINDEECTKLYNKVIKYLMLENTSTNLRIRAAYTLYIGKNNLEARQLVNRGLDEAKNSVIQGIGKFETRLLNELKQEIIAKMEKEEQKKVQDNINITRIFK